MKLTKKEIDGMSDKELWEIPVEPHINRWAVARIRNTYAWEVSRITDVDLEREHLAREARSKLDDILKPLWSLKKREAKRLIAIILNNS